MATGTTAQQIIDVVTPAAGESVSEGTILEWHVKVGDFIRATDTIIGPPRPAPQFNHSDFWAQGVTFGLAFQY